MIWTGADSVLCAESLTVTCTGAEGADGAVYTPEAVTVPVKRCAALHSIYHPDGVCNGGPVFVGRELCRLARH